MLDNACSFEDMTVEYASGEKLFNVKYGERFDLNGEIVDTNYDRYENDYVDGSVGRGAKVMTFTFDGKTLTLDFENATRTEAS